MRTALHVHAALHAEASMCSLFCSLLLRSALVCSAQDCLLLMFSKPANHEWEATSLQEGLECRHEQT